MALWFLISKYGEAAGGLHFGLSLIHVCPSSFIRELFFWGAKLATNESNTLILLVGPWWLVS